MTFYRTLQVDKSANPQQIRKAYHKLARQLHPDRCSRVDSNDLFQKVQEAYDVLSDQAKRSEYDRTSNFDNMFSSMFVDIDNILKDMQQGTKYCFVNDVHTQYTNSELVTIDLSINDYMQGCSRVIERDDTVSCGSCTGTGVCDFLNNSIACTICESTGMQLMFPCGRCIGTGRIVTNDVRCNLCNGIGRIVNRTKTEVRIPAQQSDDSIIQLHDQNIIKIKHAFGADVVEHSRGVLQKTISISVIQWLCGTRDVVSFGDRKFIVSTDGIFDMSVPLHVCDGYLIIFKLGLDRRQLKKLRKFARVFRCMFQSNFTDG